MHCTVSVNNFLMEIHFKFAINIIGEVHDVLLIILLANFQYLTLQVIASDVEHCCCTHSHNVHS